MTLNRKLRKWFLILASLIAIGIALVLLKDFIILPIAKPVQVQSPTIEYGIVTDSFSIVREEVKPGQNLVEIISEFNVDKEQSGKIAELSVGVFDLRKVRAGNEYIAMIENKGNKKLQYFIYEISDTNYIVYDFKDSLHVHFGTKEVKSRLRAASGTIQSSLWNTLEDAKADPNLAIALAQIYQWAIDFYAIQKGDEFKVIYEDLSVEGKSVGLGIIHAAWFKHAGKDYYAYRFEQGGVSEYFNQMGENLRREFLKAPLKFTRISSKFSNSRLHPVLRIRRPHHGVDYAAPSGTPVHAIGSGIVLKAAYSGGAGRIVTIKHNATYSTSYMHLSGFGSGVRTGSRVSQGQVIGYVGSSGLSTGPHLDFRFYRNGQPIDPLRVESPPAYPVSAQYKAEFDSISALYTKNFLLIKQE
ncbi:MAG: peptidoglycan DD-metalloendopeptidase family protein [Bacteroidales bacterium]|nr:peptidoglycan DD-metalloendopeptidase family protein [Bacteroidales bacterium]